MVSRDERGRLLPGSVPGWGMSWWMVDVAHTTPDRFAALDPNARIALVCEFWRAVAQGWEPAVAREDWVGPHDPFEPSPTAPASTPDQATSALLDRLPGALDRTREGMGQAARGEGVELEHLDAAKRPATAREPRPGAPPEPWLAAIRHAIEHGLANPDRPDREIREVLALALTPAGADRWFGLPNYHLGGRTPADVLAGDARAVLRAACDLAFGDG
jgi:hypothetical protein